jgi:hypothetical protein
MDKTLRIIAVGDLALNGGYHRLLAERGPDYPFRRIRARWRDAAIRFGNLESPVTHCERIAPAKLTLRGSPLAPQALLAGGFDCVSLANNHMMDFGAEGLHDTRQQLDQVGIAHVGAGRNLDEAFEPVIIKREGQSIGVLAFCDVDQVSDLYATRDSPGVAPADLAVCRELVGALRQRVDWLVVQLHWGLEMSQLPSPAQRRWAEIIASAGADVILGHHPHVVQPWDLVRGALVAYSLGDFTFSSTYWHGVNGSGAPFLAHYEVHPLSRRTGWLEVELSPGRPPVGTFHPAYLRRDLTLAEHGSFSRRWQQQRLADSLASDGYQQRFEAESSTAARRERWRRDGRRVLPRCQLKLLEHGWLRGVSVEPDGQEWRSSFSRTRQAL